MDVHGKAGATGEQTHTDVTRNASGGVTATASAQSTGQGVQQQEQTVLGSTQGECLGGGGGRGAGGGRRGNDV